MVNPWLWALSGLPLGKLIQRYCRHSDSLLLGLLLPLIFAHLLPEGVSLCSRLLLLPAFMLGMICAVFFREWGLRDRTYRSVITAVSNILLGRLWLSGYSDTPLWFCFLSEGIFLTGGVSTLWAVLPIGIGLLLPAPSGAVAGVASIALCGLSLQNTLQNLTEWCPFACSIGVAAGMLLLLI